ncbi:hypothetical protein [Rubricoccus marinus]|uniref:Uncharacterized protein n=1 Tax=Rubricoccus marinus TaxID=716817 RepID=A0A259U2G6_9BACT|nr:hypothetical protein [Rubricoccus marinus]OZC04028.1 hypothetical protein BSZ36_14170 [Rubricoccus marinus]
MPSIRSRLARAERAAAEVSSPSDPVLHFYTVNADGTEEPAVETRLAMDEAASPRPVVWGCVRISPPLTERLADRRDRERCEAASPSTDA